MIMFNGKDLKEISKKTSIELEELIFISEWVPKTVEEAEDVCSILSKNSTLQETFLATWIDLLTTTEEANQLFCKLDKEGLKLDNISLKWNKISKKEYLEIKTSNDAKKACLGAIHNSDIQKMIIVKWIDLLKTAEESREAYYCSSVDSKSKEKILFKWKNFCLEEIKTVADAKKHYSSLPDGCKKEVLAKWIDISYEIEELVEAFNKTKVGSELRKIAVLKIIVLS